MPDTYGGSVDHCNGRFPGFIWNPLTKVIFPFWSEIIQGAYSHQQRNIINLIYRVVFSWAFMNTAFQCSAVSLTKFVIWRYLKKWDCGTINHLSTTIYDFVGKRQFCHFAQAMSESTTEEVHSGLLVKSMQENACLGPKWILCCAQIRGTQFYNVLFGSGGVLSILWWHHQGCQKVLCGIWKIDIFARHGGYKQRLHCSCIMDQTIVRIKIQGTCIFNDASLFMCLLKSLNLLEVQSVAGLARPFNQLHSGFCTLVAMEPMEENDLDHPTLLYWTIL